MGVRVLQLISPTAIYGAERWILALASQLDQSRVNCDLAITDEGQSAAVELAELFSKFGNTYRVPMSNTYDLRCIKKIVDIIRETNVDIVHTHGYKSDLIGLAAAKWAGCKAISTPHGFGSDIDSKLSLFIKVGARFLRYFDQVVPLSEQLKREVVGLGVPEKRVLMIENATDLSEIDAANRKSDGKKLQNIRLGYVGQLIPRKRVDHVILAFDRLAQKNSNIELVIAGDGGERSKLEELATSLRSSPRISFEGFIEDRLPFMSTLDLFLLGSSSEGIPRCLMESMALGVVPIAYKIEGVTELISHGRNGFCVTDGDIDAFTDAIGNLISDTCLRDRFSEEAAKTIRVRFSADRMAREYTDLFEMVVDIPRA